MPNDIPPIERLREQLSSVPIFPLPAATLLPQELMPLHIFEPRYREMIRDVLDGERPLAIARLAPGWESNYEGRPAVEPICGVGFVFANKLLPDGRYDIGLAGVARARIVEELPSDKLYREARLELLDDVWPAAGPESLMTEEDRVRALIFQLAVARPGRSSGMLTALAAHATSASELADVVLGSVVKQPDERWTALTTLNVAARLRQAEAALSWTLADLTSADGKSPRH